MFWMPTGPSVVLQGVADVPDGTVGIIELIDDLGFVFIETPDNVPNVVLNANQAHMHIKKEEF